MFISALFMRANMWKLSKCPSTDEWIKKKVVCTYNGILFSPKKEKILQYMTTWKNLEVIMLSEINQSQKDKYCMSPLI